MIAVPGGIGPRFYCGGGFLAEAQLGMAAFHTADRRKTFEKLKAKGVEFVSEPKDQFYGVEAVFKDPFGNWFSLTQPKNY